MKLNVKALAFVLFLLLLIKSSSGQFPEFDSILSLPVKLPAKYDLRNSERLSPVRAQAAGGCWAAASLASFESFYRTANGTSPVFSDKNLYYFHQYDSTRTTYGNHMMSTAYFIRGGGPYISTPELDTTKQTKNPNLLITSARFLPDEPELIKRAIYYFGGVSTMLRFRPETLDSLTFIHYASSNKINHVANLIGWVDDMETDVGTGVWIAQNSLGVKSGEKGFFYIPYQDQSVLQYNAVWPDWDQYRENLRLIFYDTLGKTSSYGFEDTVCYGLMKFIAPENGLLERIGTWTTTENTEIDAEVYKSFDTTLKQLDDKIGEMNTQRCRFEGYYNFLLNKPVRLKKGDAFYIKVRYSVPSDTSRVPTEQFVSDYAYPHIETSKCWINPDDNKWPNTWYLCGKTSDYPVLNFDICIKAYFLADNN